MKKTLKTWLEEERGRAAALAEVLHVTPSAITQAMNGDIRIPPSWYVPIRDFTKGEVTIEALLPASKGAESATQA